MNAISGLLLLALLGAEEVPSKTNPAPRANWELTLPEAIRIGLTNADGVRTVCERIEEDGRTYVTIASADRVITPLCFKANVMAVVRSIEQQYWSLVQHQAQLRAGARAVDIARAVLEQEQADLPNRGRGTIADVAEAERRLDQFLLDLTAKQSDVSMLERQLRGTLGLPPDDTRRIQPITAAVESEVKPDWNDCLAAMMKAEPRIAQQRMMVYASGLQYLVSQGPSALVSALGLRLSDAPDVAQARSSLQQQQELLQQVVRQSTHSLARSFLEVDANYKQLQTARRFVAASNQLMEAQQPSFDEEHTPIDRYLDAVSQHARAAAHEAQFRTAYNIALLALEEKKGTLLEARQVTLSEEAPVAEPAQVASTALPDPIEDPEVRQAGAEMSRGPAHSQNMTFDLLIGETLPIRVRGTISITPGTRP